MSDELHDTIAHTLVGINTQAAAAAHLQRGDRVTIQRGPFRWVEAVFDRRLTATGRVRILLDFVHRTVAVDLDACDLA